MSDVRVPLLQAIITGFLCAALTGSIASAWAVRERITALVPLGVYVVTLSGVTTFTWVRMLSQSVRSQYQRETYTQQADNEEPEPTAQAQDNMSVTVITKAPGNTDESRLEPGDVQENYGLPVSRDTLRAVYKSVLCNAHQWSQRSVSAIPGAGLSEPQARDLLGAMLEAGLLAHRGGQPNHPKGHTLTPAGRAIGRQLGAEVSGEVSE